MHTNVHPQCGTAARGRLAARLALQGMRHELSPLGHDGEYHPACNMVHMNHSLAYFASCYWQTTLNVGRHPTGCLAMRDTTLLSTRLAYQYSCCVVPTIPDSVARSSVCLHLIQECVEPLRPPLCCTFAVAGFWGPNAAMPRRTLRCTASTLRRYPRSKLPTVIAAVCPVPHGTEGTLLQLSALSPVQTAWLHAFAWSPQKYHCRQQQVLLRAAEDVMLPQQQQLLWLC